MRKILLGNRNNLIFNDKSENAFTWENLLKNAEKTESLYFKINAKFEKGLTSWTYVI